MYYIAPKESMDSILKDGILPPKEVTELIEKGILKKDVLGVSYGIDSSNFPEYISLIENFNIVDMVAEQICHSRTGKYKDSNFTVMIYFIDNIINTHKEFISNNKVRELNHHSYPSEVLYKGRISPSLIIGKKETFW